LNTALASIDLIRFYGFFKNYFTMEGNSFSHQYGVIPMDILRAIGVQLMNAVEKERS
jgi:hypothetical protein